MSDKFTSQSDRSDDKIDPTSYDDYQEKESVVQSSLTGSDVRTEVTSASSDLEGTTVEGREWINLKTITLAQLQTLTANFDAQSPEDQRATNAALDAATTFEEKEKIYNGPMFRPPSRTPAQIEQAERDRLFMLLMSGRTEEAVAMSKKDENGCYINPWEKRDKPSQ
ncbi:hypothetical protein FFLO_06874 [Filobasidium floriforme]|uniref:Uncharacterized protein n=1 Tax=Filobasidium floriforme TaxID=5210 RepID=A0A8K0JEJ8_9TREE|nr:uncharacterized protein HD553DRAFT_341457 [Filobasidium floriforme]KAG7527502.1 hypothetical protein FFLO_06874 [Filobasidium floriforme]KAH8085667.1 hypothetical protein HD553DRAFT_341457 [Filobasidium floriforme]